jgi:hypothetical protein
VSNTLRPQAPRGAQSPEALAIIPDPLRSSSRSITALAAMVRDAPTGKYRRTRLSMLTLGFSRKCVRLLYFNFGARIWVELHEHGFRAWVERPELWCSATSRKASSHAGALLTSNRPVED